MDDQGKAGEAASLILLDEVRRRRQPEPVHFTRRELDLILHVYSLMVGAGAARDYRIDSTGDRAVFHIHRRAGEMAAYRVDKVPALARKQAEYGVIAADGSIAKRGPDLVALLKAFDKPLRLALARRDGRLR